MKLKDLNIIVPSSIALISFVIIFSILPHFPIKLSELSWYLWSNDSNMPPSVVIFRYEIFFKEYPSPWDNNSTKSSAIIKKISPKKIGIWDGQLSAILYDNVRSDRQLGLNFVPKIIRLNNSMIDERIGRTVSAEVTRDIFDGLTEKQLNKLINVASTIAGSWARTILRPVNKVEWANREYIGVRVNMPINPSMLWALIISILLCVTYCSVYLIIVKIKIKN